MNKTESIAVFSTHAKDVVIKNGSVQSTQAGGPAMFIEAALRTTSIPFQIHTGDQLEVSILVNDQGEFGKIEHTPDSAAIPLERCPEWVIVSTLLTEWDIKPMGYKGHLFVDIQGFVRDGSDFGKKKVWNIDKVAAGQIFCLKGTEQEISYLPLEISEQQKNKLLISTRGNQGAVLWYQGKMIEIPAQPVLNLPDTIGAGDTFMAHLVISMFEGADPIEATQIATINTAEFLRSKLARL